MLELSWGLPFSHVWTVAQDTYTRLLLVAGKEPKIFTSAPLLHLSPQGDS